MNIEEYAKSDKGKKLIEESMEGRDKLDGYLIDSGGEEGMKKRINEIFHFMLWNRIPMLALMTKQMESFMQTIHDVIEEDGEKYNDNDHIKAALKCFVLLIDTLVYSGYLSDDYLPAEMKFKKVNSDENTEAIAKKAYKDFKNAKDQIIKSKKNGK